MVKPVFLDLGYMDSIEHFVMFDVVNAYNSQELSLDGILDGIIHGSRLHRKEVIEADASFQKQNPNGSICLRKLEGNRYLITLTMPSYIIVKDKSAYAFNEILLGAIVQTNEASLEGKQAEQLMLRVEHPPTVLNTPYHHPFVYESGSLDFDPNEACGRWDTNKDMVKFMEWYPIHDEASRRDTAQIIAKILKIAQKTLERSYSGRPGRDYHPVRHIENCSCRVSEEGTAAFDYARQNRIKPERVFSQN